MHVDRTVDGFVDWHVYDDSESFRKLSGHVFEKGDVDLFDVFVDFGSFFLQWLSFQWWAEVGFGDDCVDFFEEWSDI